MKSRDNFEAVMETCGGLIVCYRCQAFSKRTKKQCKSPAVTGKTKCRFHGGKSTGPKTPEGLQRIIDANTDHGLYTRFMREQQRKESIALLKLEQRMVELGMISSKKAGRKPNGFYEETQDAVNPDKDFM